MTHTNSVLPAWLRRISLLSCLLLALGLTASAMAYTTDDGVLPGEFNGASDTSPDAPPPPEGAGTTSQGPVRMARFSYIDGNVTWRPDAGVEWSQASINVPFRQGGQIYVRDHGRAEIQFDDGSLLRVGDGALVTLQTLYSDADGEFTELKLNDGLATLRLKNEHSLYQIDTPFASVRAVGPARVRVGVSDTVEVAVKAGRVTIEGQQGQKILNTGDFAELRDASSEIAVNALPGDDGWEQWNDERDAALEPGPSTQANLPSNIAVVAPDLDEYGSWHDSPEYGHVWYPHVVAGWCPYHYGHWVWVNPFGWTWCSEERWGWAPYHYGTWCRTGYGWGWVPGPVCQYWSPAVVHFCEVNGGLCWVPLHPHEIRYPSALSIGFHSGNWSLFFSIGQAGCYYPGHDAYCESRPWNTTYVNHVTYVTNITNVTNINHGAPTGPYYPQNRNSYIPGGHFIPANVRSGGGSFATTSGFQGGGSYKVLPPTNTAIFANARYVGAPANHAVPVAGPITMRPTLASLTPTHTFVPAAPPTTVATRPVFHAPTSAQIARTGLAAQTRMAARGTVSAPNPASGLRADRNGFTGRVGGMPQPGSVGSSGRNGSVAETGPGSSNGRNGGASDRRPAGSTSTHVPGTITGAQSAGESGRNTQGTRNGVPLEVLRARASLGMTPGGRRDAGATNGAGRTETGAPASGRVNSGSTFSNGGQSNPGIGTRPSSPPVRDYSNGAPRRYGSGGSGNGSTGAETTPTRPYRNQGNTGTYGGNAPRSGSFGGNAPRTGGPSSYHSGGNGRSGGNASRGESHSGGAKSNNDSKSNDSSKKH